MATTKNIFDVLSGSDSEDETVKSPSPAKETQETQATLVLGAPVAKADRKFKTSWADASDEDPLDDPFEHDFPTLGAEAKTAGRAGKLEVEVETVGGVKVQMTEEEKKAFREFDLTLGKLKTIEIAHNARVPDPETGEMVNGTRTRRFRVVSKDLFMHFKRLVDSYKTHKGEVVNYENQSKKAKLANELMDMCYKNSEIPCCFEYPVVHITTRDGKILTRNRIDIRERVDDRGRKRQVVPTCFFEVKELSFYPPWSADSGKAK
jgi:hypothetical protein